MCKGLSDIYELNDQFLKIKGNPDKWYKMQEIVEKMDKIAIRIVDLPINVQKILANCKDHLGNLALSRCLG